MSLLRLTLSLAIAGSCSAVMAEQITCESHGSRADACGTVQPGSTVRLVRQLSNSPCIEGRTWGSGDDSIWVSNGCRAVFDVQPPYDDSANRDHNQRNYNHSDHDRQHPQYAEQGDEDRNDDNGRGDQQDRSDERDRGDDRRQQDQHSGRGGQRRDQARQTCAYHASEDRSFGPEQVQTNDIRWIGEGRLSLNLDTPDGPLTCIVDRSGNVTLNEDR